MISDNCDAAPAPRRVDTKIARIDALSRIAGPLADFMISAGLGIRDVNSIIRDAAVRIVAAKHATAGRRVNISGIAASTGIPRTEISKILKRNSGDSRQPFPQNEPAGSRVLCAWLQGRKYCDDSGVPLSLKVYGRGRSFDSLAQKYGRGIPTRAILEELILARAVEMLKSGLVRPTSSVADNSHLTVQAIKIFGEATSELMSTLLHNIRHPESPYFFDRISESSVTASAPPLLKKELAETGRAFLLNLQSITAKCQPSNERINQSCSAGQVSVTIFFNEQSRESNVDNKDAAKRKNLKRASS